MGVIFQTPSVYIYIYIYIHTHTHTLIYIYIYKIDKYVLLLHYKITYIQWSEKLGFYPSMNPGKKSSLCNFCPGICYS